ncbi:cytochrome b/b6 domain-containing protein [Roseovarius sp. CAU 1744]|uniref:cytochrome b/b6 domain-containing protein n=1 Tax=Roseovarius sp. CAU 1744 TaxID=3140368 RepID=UPI00325B9706
MPLSNSEKTYGSVTKTFHWLTALLILSAIPLGIIASDLAHDLQDTTTAPDEATLALTATLFSLHKTIGVSVFFVALARIVWAVSQPKPGLLNGDNPPEAWLAETVHWLLYGSLVAVPLTGWAHHAATTGYAPIWWPFGQALPFVPRDPAVAEFAATLHYILQWVLVGAVGLHIVGAFKHHVIDGDATLRRMLPGRSAAEPTAQQPGHALPLVTALAIWATALGGATALGWFSRVHENPATAEALAQVESDWQVQDGTLSVTVRQLGSDVTGQFADWTAKISYDETPDDSGKHGQVEVTIATPSLNLGSVSAQAKGTGYLDTTAHPTATFAADLLAREGGNVAVGSLTIREQSVPVEMPFELSIEGDTATAAGSVDIDRRDFGIGADVNNEGSLGFTVGISFELTAVRQ